MNNAKYALRANFFGFNDEYWRLSKSYSEDMIRGIYNDFDAAMEAWKQAEYKKLRSNPLYNIENYSELPREKLQALDEVVFEWCGKHISNADWVWEYGEEIVAQMDVAQTFEFLKRADLFFYTVVEFDASRKIYAGWLPDEARYFQPEETLYGGDCDGIYCTPIAENLLGEYVLEMGFPELNGELAELSHSPEILRSLTNSEPDIRYNEQTKRLSVENSSLRALMQILPLLINPPIEIREVTVARLNELPY